MKIVNHAVVSPSARMLCMTCKLLINTCEDKLTFTVPLCGFTLLFKAKTDDVYCRMDGPVTCRKHSRLSDSERFLLPPPLSQCKLRRCGQLGGRLTLSINAHTSLCRCIQSLCRLYFFFFPPRPVSPWQPQTRTARGTETGADVTASDFHTSQTLKDNNKPL